ncbi:MAG: hypothetical protein F6J87_22700 [Spirulina sp. SIO3F2]|nr:hypothetical protein [Spirulina sp. SIO3F2]
MGLLGGCVPWAARLGFPKTTAQVQQQYAGVTMQISGTVVQQAPFLEGGAYALQDQTGLAWVFTEMALPELNSQVTVEGVVRREVVFWGDRTHSEHTAYLQEIERQD